MLNFERLLLTDSLPIYCLSGLDYNLFCCMNRLAQHAGIPHYQKMSKNVLYERLQRLGQGLERIRRLEERTSGTPLAPSSFFATSSSSRLFLRSAGSLKDVAVSGENGSKKRKREEGEESSSHLGHVVRYTSSVVVVVAADMAVAVAPATAVAVAVAVGTAQAQARRPAMAPEASRKASPLRSTRTVVVAVAAVVVALAALVTDMVAVVSMLV